MFVTIQFRNVDVDKSNARVAERSFGRGCKIGVTSADADDNVGLGCDSIRRERTGRSNGAQVPRMIAAERTFARLRFTNGNSGGCTKLGKDFGGLAVNNASARDNQRLFGTPQKFRSTVQRLAIRAVSRDSPNTFFKQLQRIVIRLGLNILR